MVEAVGGRALRVELRERERGRVVGRDDRVEAHAVLLELRAQAAAEAVGGQAAEVGDRLLEPPERARAVERTAAQVRADVVAVLHDEIDQRFPADEDHAGESRLPCTARWVLMDSLCLARDFG